MDDKSARDAGAIVVLVLVRDVLGAGLFAALVETMGNVAVFPIAGERADLAVRRLRPRIVLLDCFHPAARMDELFAAVDSVAARVLLFTAGEPWAEVEQIARRPEVAVFVHPTPGRSFADLLQDALRRI
jgi:AmiR/NasT family two-component response regulator